MTAKVISGLHIYPQSCAYTRTHKSLYTLSHTYAYTQAHTLTLTPSLLYDKQFIGF